MAALRPTKVQVHLQTGTDRTLYATWSWNKSGTDKYDISWKYDTGDGVWFVGNDGTSEVKQSTYSAPNNAKRVRFKVRAVPKKGQKWKSDWSTTVTYDLVEENLTDPGAPTVTVIGQGLPNTPNRVLKLTASINDYTAIGATHIRFELVRDNNARTAIRSEPIALKTTYAATSWNVEVGHKYKVRAQGLAAKTKTVKTSTVSKTTSKVEGIRYVTIMKDLSVENNTKQTKVIYKDGVWSTYSEEVSTGFGRVERIISIETYSAYNENGGVRVTWEGVANFNALNPDHKYTVEYTDDEEKFDSGEVQSSSDHKLTHAEITGLELNKTYYFRVRAEDNTNQGAWSPIASMAVGTVPGPPTTWSFRDSVSIGDDITLNWAHSSDDGSTQTEATITFTMGETTYEKVIEGDTSTLVIKTSTEEEWNETFDSNLPYPSGDAILLWKVKTKGIVPDYGVNSTERSINIYEPVNLSAQLYSEGQWLWDPFNFETDTILTAPAQFGEPVEDVTSFPIRIGFTTTPDSQSAIAYSVSITADEAYDAEDATGGHKHVSRGDEIYNGYFIANPDTPNLLDVTLYPGDIDLENNVSYTLNAVVAMDSGLTGECELYFNVLLEDEEYYPSAEIVINEDNYSASIRPFCEDEFGNEITDVYLNVYRREYNGSFTPIEVNLDAADQITVTDPHPSLDYARYRIVAMSKSTGAISYDDIPGWEIGLDSIVIQWNETWSNFDVDDLESLDEQPAESSMLILPYNIDISAAMSPDVALVNYIGNEHPVSYYGTQRGESGAWTCEIPKSDKETLYNVRRLANWMGDVYIREPSGIGYWAQVNVSYSLQYSKTTVPVTFNVTRVEGGV